MIRIEQIRGARAMLGLSQQVLANKAGISVATLNNLERGAQTDPKVSTMNAIRSALEAEGISFIEIESQGFGVCMKADARALGEKTILIIDDSKADRLLYRKWLSDSDEHAFKVVETANGTEGYDALLRYRPACIVLDFVMYGMNGFQLLVEMKQCGTPLPPIIFITGVQRESIKEEMLKQGVNSYLTKDKLTPEVFLKAVTDALK